MRAPCARIPGEGASEQAVTRGHAPCSIFTLVSRFLPCKRECVFSFGHSGKRT
jgi:hypothetical protein